MYVYIQIIFKYLTTFEIDKIELSFNVFEITIYRTLTTIENSYIILL